MEETADEANKDKNSGDDSNLVESGKKDPTVRRQELLIKSGLAEVGYHGFKIYLPIYLSSSFHRHVSVSDFLIFL